MPTFYAIGGPNGSGKTTFMKSFIDDKIPFIRPDDLLVSDPYTLSELIRQQFQQFAVNGQSFAFEHNFHTQSSYNYFDWATKHGYETHLIYLAIADVQICLDRVKERVSSGRGHHVEESIIRQRFSDSLFNLKINLRKVDQVSIIDNTDFVAPKPCLVFQKGKLVSFQNPPIWLQKLLERYL